MKIKIEDPIKRLEQIRANILSLITEAEGIIRRTTSEPTDRNKRIALSAEGYWISHIRAALGKTNSWCAGSMHTISDTIEDLKNKENEE